MKEIPCKDCICVPICRGKSFDHLYLKCSLFSEFMDEPKFGTYITGKEIYRRKKMIDNYLNPNKKMYFWSTYVGERNSQKMTQSNNNILKKE